MPVKLPTIVEESSSKEHHRAQWWRIHIVHMTVQELADLTGYSPQVIYLMERGVASDGTLVKPWAWKRYKMACAGVHAQIAQERSFDWGREPDA